MSIAYQSRGSIMRVAAIPRLHRVLPVCAVLLVTGLALKASPDCLPNDWTPHGIGGGGGMFSPVISPHDANVMFLSVDMGSVMRTLDGGATWKILPFTSLQGQQQTQIQFTNTAQTLYAAERGRDPLTEGNLFRPRKSLNLGDDWLSFSAWPPSGYPNERAVSVWADPDRDDSLLVASDTRLWFYRGVGTNGTFSLLGSFPSGNARVAGVYWSSTSEEVWVGSSDGIYYHADPASGGSFSAVTSPPVGNRIISFTGAFSGGVLRFYAITTQLAVTATKSPQSFAAGAYNRVYRIDWLTDPSWTLETGIPSTDYPIEVGMARNRINCAHVSVARSSSYPNQHSIYRQDGPGTAWTRTLITEGNGNLYTGWGSINSNSGPVANTLETSISYAYPCGMAVSPADAEYVVICDNCVIHRCENACQSSPIWAQVYTTADNSNHSPGQLFPHGQSYRTNGLELTVSYWVDWSSATDVFLSGLDYLAPHSTDGGTRWGFDYNPTAFPSGDVPQVVSDATTGYRYAICSFAMTLYEYLGTDDVNVDFTGLGGKGAPGLWSLAPGVSQWLPVRQDFGVGEEGSDLIRGANPTWVVVDAARRRLYVAVSNSRPEVDGVYLQNLNTGIWKKLPSPTAGAFRPANTSILHPFNIRILSNGDLLVSYAARQAGGANAGYTQSSGVFYYSHSLDTWVDKSTRLELRYATRDIAVDPHDPSELTWYACVSNTDLALTSPASSDAPHIYGGLYKTIDGGGSWTLVWNGESGVAGKPGIVGQTNVTGCSVNSVTLNPDKPYELWMTTRYCGLWICQNINTASPIFEQSSYPFRAPERVFFNPYVTDEVWITSNGYGLNIAHRPKAFPLWQKDHFPTQSGNDLIIGADADPDADGLGNLLEYALLTDPASFTSTPMPTITTGPNQRLSLAFNRIADPALVYSVSASNDLVDWGVAPIWTSTAAQNTNGQVVVPDLVDISASPQRFLRLQVTKP